MDILAAGVCVVALIVAALAKAYQIGRARGYGEGVAATLRPQIDGMREALAPMRTLVEQTDPLFRRGGA